MRHDLVAPPYRRLNRAAASLVLVLHLGACCSATQNPPTPCNTGDWVHVELEDLTFDVPTGWHVTLDQAVPPTKAWLIPPGLKKVIFIKPAGFIGRASVDQAKFRVEVLLADTDESLGDTRQLDVETSRGVVYCAIKSSTEVSVACLRIEPTAGDGTVVSIFGVAGPSFAKIGGLEMVAELAARAHYTAPAK